MLSDSGALAKIWGSIKGQLIIATLSSSSSIGICSQDITSAISKPSRCKFLCKRSSLDLRSKIAKATCGSRWAHLHEALTLDRSAHVSRKYCPRICKTGLKFLLAPTPKQACARTAKTISRVQKSGSSLSSRFERSSAAVSRAVPAPKEFHKTNIAKKNT